MYKCYNCEEIYEEEPEDRVCRVCFEQTVVKAHDERIN